MTRTIRIEKLWILPALFALVIWMTISSAPAPLSLLAMAGLAVALIAGLPLGWLRGKTMQLALDPQTRELKGTMSAFGFLFLVGLVVLRSLGRTYLTSHSESLQVDPTVIVDAFMLFALGMIIGRQVEVYIRGVALLQQEPAPQE